MTEDAENQPVNALFVGLPKTGKTTYLALAYGTILDDDACGVRLDAHDDDLAYLNRILEALQEYRPAAHTLVGQTEGLSLSLRFGQHETARVEVPDLSGETWEGVHVDRVWERELVGAVPICTGFVLFTNVDDHKAVQTVTELQADTEALGDTSWDENAPHTPDVPEAPTQLVLVDLLHALRRVHRGTFRVSVVLSAYDAAEPPGITPADWIEENLPLLAQYLAVNADVVDSRAFGVSGQGGSYPPSDDQLAVSLLERAYVLRPDGQKTTLLAPLLWALGRDDAD
jgi:hypothetical protein